MQSIAWVWRKGKMICVETVTFFLLFLNSITDSTHSLNNVGRFPCPLLNLLPNAVNVSADNLTGLPGITLIPLNLADESLGGDNMGSLAG